MTANEKIQGYYVSFQQAMQLLTSKECSRVYPLFIKLSGEEQPDLKNLQSLIAVINGTSRLITKITLERDMYSDSELPQSLKKGIVIFTQQLKQKIAEQCYLESACAQSGLFFSREFKQSEYKNFEPKKYADDIVVISYPADEKDEKSEDDVSMSLLE